MKSIRSIPVAFLFRSDVRGVSGFAGGGPSDCDPDGGVDVKEPSELGSATPPPSEELCDVTDVVCSSSALFGSLTALDSSISSSTTSSTSYLTAGSGGVSSILVGDSCC